MRYAMRWRVRALISATLVSLIAALTCVYGTTPANAAGALAWSSETNVSHSGQQSLMPTLRTGPDGTQHLVWMEMAVPGLPWEIRYTNSTDGGKTWSKVYKVSINSSPLSSTMMDVSMAVDSRNQAHVVWSERDSSRMLHIFYRRRNADGTWTDKVALAKTATKAGDGYSGTPNIDIAVNPAAPDLIHVVWKGALGASRFGQWAIYYAASTNGGATWGNFQTVSESGSGASHYNFVDQATILAEPDGTVHVMWRGAQKGMQARHLVNGKWGNIEKVDGYGWNVSMANAPNGGLYAVYQGYSTGGTARGIRFAQWTPASTGSNNGKWSSPLPLTDPKGAYLNHPSITVDASGKMYLAYDRSSGQFGIAYRTSTDGKHWTNPVDVSGVRAQFPRLHFQNGLFTLVYAARIGSNDNFGNPNYDIVFRKAAG